MPFIEGLPDCVHASFQTFSSPAGPSGASDQEASTSSMFEQSARQYLRSGLSSPLSELSQTGSHTCEHRKGTILHLHPYQIISAEPINEIRNVVYSAHCWPVDRPYLCCFMQVKREGKDVAPVTYMVRHAFDAARHLNCMSQVM